MKKTLKSLALLAAIAATLSSCVTVTQPIAATSNPVGNKCGEASTTKVFYFFGGKSNSGINQAAKNAGITKISHVDMTVKSSLYGLYTKRTTRVYGE